MKLNGWAIITARGSIFFALTRPTRREALAAFETKFGVSWGKRRRHGWRCAPITITEARRARA